MAPAHHILKFTFAVGLIRIVCVFHSKAPDHLKPDIEQDSSGKELEIVRIRKIGHSQDSTNKKSRQSASHYYPSQRPNHSAFLTVALNTAGDGYDIEQLIGNADRWVCV